MAVNAATRIHAAVAVVFEEAEAVRREQSHILQPHVDIAAALDGVRDAAVRSVFGADHDQVAHLLGISIVPAGAGEAEMTRVHDLNIADTPILTPQRPRVWPEYFVLEVANRFGGCIAIKKATIINLS